MNRKDKRYQERVFNKVLKIEEYMDKLEREIDDVLDEMDKLIDSIILKKQSDEHRDSDKQTLGH